MREAGREVLDVLACEIELRPVGAPGIDAIAKSVLNVTRDGERGLAVSFDPAVRTTVEAFVAAECQCCSTLSWTIEAQEDALRVVIGAEPQQIDVLEALFSAAP